MAHQQQRELQLMMSENIPSKTYTHKSTHTAYRYSSVHSLALYIHNIIIHVSINQYSMHVQWNL